MARPVHFELNADIPERAMLFYKTVFGWSFEKWEGDREYWLITTGDDDKPGINGALMHRLVPGASTVNTIEVSSVEEYSSFITRHGGSAVTEKQALPGVGYHAYFRDTEGNIFALIEFDPDV